MVSYIEGGKRVQVTKTASSKRQAEKLRTQLLVEKDKGILIKPNRLTIQDHFIHWIDDYVVPNLSPITAETYRFLIKKHICPRLGNISLQALRPQTVQSLYSDGIKSGLSNATVRKIHNILHKALENAVKT